MQLSFAAPREELQENQATNIGPHSCDNSSSDLEPKKIHFDAINSIGGGMCADW